MKIDSCIPVIPSANLEKSLRFWVEGLGFKMDSEMRVEGRLVGCMLRGAGLAFWLNSRAGTPVKPDHYEGIRLYWAPSDIQEAQNHLKRLGFAVSEIVARDYGQTEFSVTDEDGYSHCFGVATNA
jgi:catechol 2,3-dioxygenase-like lactoylglutathione lyase family enzyme